MAARSQPNDNWGSVGNGAKLRRKALRWCVDQLIDVVMFNNDVQEALYCSLD